MKIFEIIMCEAPVVSSWITNITLNPNQSVVMALSNGRRFRVQNVNKALYAAWIAAPSKGIFWHQRIRGKHITKRIL